MTDKSTTKPPMWFWIVSIVALLWNGFGVDAYIGQAYQTERWKSQFTAEQLEMANNAPSWVTAAFALAVFGGLLGCIALLLRKKLARPILLVSLVAIIAQMTYQLFISKALEVYGPGGAIMPILVIVVGVFLLWLSKKGITKGWLT